jgi:DNA-binding NtrC family response regulator
VVLLLDDDPGFRSALAQNLREDGHEVRAFERPADLPNLGELSHVHILVTDYSFGKGEDGLDLSRRFNATHPGKPAILLTGYADDVAEEGVAHLPFLRLLTKPLRYEVLHGLIHSLVL